MKTSDAITLAIRQGGKRQADLVETGLVNSPQAANRKVAQSRWSVDDLITVAGWLGGKVIFQMPNGEQYELTP